MSKYWIKQKYTYNSRDGVRLDGPAVDQDGREIRTKVCRATQCGWPESYCACEEAFQAEQKRQG